MSGPTGGPLVSVVMIFWNAQRFFADAVRSVLGQTHPVELLLCDDGSTDGSTRMALDWAAREPGRVRYLEHPGHAHRGMSATRNLGIGAASGELVAFLDADDVWHPEHVACQVATLRDHAGADLVCGPALDWFGWDPDAGEEARAREQWSPLPWPPGTVVAPPGMLTALLRRGAYTTPINSLLVRTRCLRAVGGSEPSFTDMFEDQALLAKLHLAYPSVLCGAHTALYRQHADSSTAVARQQGTYSPVGPNPSQEAFLRWLTELLETRQAGADGELRAALACALRLYDDPWARRRWQAAARARAMVPRGTRPALRRLASAARRRAPVVMGTLRSTRPLSREFGYDRGLPVDRHYVEQFLAQNAHLIGGRVLEVADDEYTRRFGGQRVTRSDVLHVNEGHAGATIVADLADGATIPSASFDCIVLTQTLQFVYDVRAAVRTLHRILRPGGTLLATLPGISPLSTDEWAPTWYWAFTPVSARRLFGEVFGDEQVEVAGHGNVLTSVAFLEGMAAHELRERELGLDDPQFPMLISVRAFRRAS